jgi:hypothetical protein
VNRAAAFAAAQKGFRTLSGTLSRLLSHPLTLVLVAGGISALIVPMLTQRWQDHQRQLDVQTALVSQMTQAATEFVVASRLRIGDRSAR